MNDAAGRTRRPGGNASETAEATLRASGNRSTRMLLLSQIMLGIFVATVVGAIVGLVLLMSSGGRH